MHFTPYTRLKGVPRWRDRFVQYGIKVSFWGSGTLKIVIYVENYPQKRCFRLAYYYPLGGLVRGVTQRTNIYPLNICTYRGGKQRTSRQPTYTEIVPRYHDSGGKIGCVIAAVGQLRDGYFGPAGPSDFRSSVSLKLSRL